MDDGLLRQRRSLIAVSVALILFDFADVRIAKIGILGTDLIVGNVTVLIAFAWVVWAYFLLRFHQYLSQQKRPVLSTLRDQALERYASEFVQSAWVSERNPSKYRLTPFVISPWRIELADRWQDPGTGKEAGPCLVVPREFVLKWNFRFHLWYLFRSTNFTDFVLPYLLAFAAPIVTAAVNSNSWL